MPDADLSHLQDVLAEHVQNDGNFSFKGYNHQLKAQAILGADLAENSSLMKKLMQVQPAVLFRYADLKDVMGKIVHRFSSVRESFPINRQEKAAAKLSNSLMTMCTHTRRLRDPNRLREACITLAAWQSSKLVCARKKTIKKHIKQGKPRKEKEDSTSAMKAMKAMKAVKTLKASLPQNLQDYKLTTMDYKTGACAVRIVGGKQLFQVSRFSPSVNKKHAKNFLEKLKGGCFPGQGAADEGQSVKHPYRALGAQQASPGMTKRTSCHPVLTSICVWITRSSGIG